MATSTPEPEFSSGTGTLTHDPSYDRIGCSQDWLDPTVISLIAVDSAAFVRFEVPTSRQWSIGFVYHEIDDKSHSATYISSDRLGNMTAVHYSMRDGIHVDGPITVPIPDGVFFNEGGKANELVFRTTSNGSFIRLNEEIVIDVAPAQLTRGFGWSTLCVGFVEDENERYQIEISDLRTSFEKQRESGIVIVAPLFVNRMECPDDVEASAFLDALATDGWVLVDIIVPEDRQWSFGLVYHNTGTSHSRTYLGSDGERMFAKHINVSVFGVEVVQTNYFNSELIQTGDDAKNILEIETTSEGSSLRLNGETVLEVAPSDLNRNFGLMELCAAVDPQEDDFYALGFADMWAWTDWDWSVP